ncbi:MAG: hypothetical protein ACLVME_01860 [Ezakiella coagulans]|uniref:hypothetical protein n=1 Tax=Ezakiella coagulans TaxID=46507 RepID=UPI00399A3941
MHSLNIDFFKEIRREAYVKAIGAKMTADNVVGTFGNVDEAFLRAYSLIPYPIISVDGFIYQYGDVNEDCDAINSTRIYLETGKCPILFSSKFIVHSNLCPIFVEKISKVTDKKFISIDNTSKFLEMSGYSFDDKIYDEQKKLIETIDEKLKFLEKTDIDSKLLSYAKFYLLYEPELKKRIDILDDLIKENKLIDNERKIVRALCPYGILDGIDAENYSVIESTNDVDCAPDKCAFCNKKYIKYEV